MTKTETAVRCRRLAAGLMAGVAAAALTAGAAQAGEMLAASRIDAVTVFPDGAIVTRLVEVDLPQGATTLVFKGLPLALDPASLRVEGKATGALTLGAVEARLVPVDPAKISSETEAELKTLREESDRLSALIDAQEGRKAMIQRFAQSGPDRGDKVQALDVAQWGTAWEAVGAALAKVNTELLASRTALRTTDARIKAIEASIQARRPRGAPERDFTVALEAGQALKGQLTLVYRVAGANWRPVYDARLTTAEGGKAGGLTLTRRAIVIQRTGEDWGDVDLTLSTVRAARGTAAPEVDPQRVAFFEPPLPMPMAAGAPGGARRKAAAPMEDAARGGMAETAMAPAAPMPLQRAEAKEASLESNGFQASYRIPGRLSVPRDGSEKSFSIQSREIQPELLIKAAPALDPTAYLEAAFVNAEEAPLLAGQVSLIRDGAFVGRGALAFTAPGDRVTLGFGADERVKVVRVPVRRKETEPYLLGNTKSDTREFKITVKNLHDFAVKTQIIDQIPFSEAANLTVEPLAGTTPPTEKTVQDKRGVMGWTYELKPREEREIKLGYRMRWPSDREIVFDRAPNPR